MLNTMMREVAQLQSKYEKLRSGNSMTKKAICDLCVPFRDKYNLTDRETLSIARNEYSIAEIIQLFDRGKEDIFND